MKYSQIINYLSTLGSAYAIHELHVIPKDIYLMTQAQLENISYPALLIESPLITLNGDMDHTDESWTLAFAVIMNSKPGDSDRTLYNKNTTLTIVQDLLAQIMAHAAARFCIFRQLNVSDTRIDAVTMDTTDFVFGWRVEITVNKKFDTSIIGKFNEAIYNSFSFTYTDSAVTLKAPFTTADWKLYISGVLDSETDDVGTLDISAVGAGLNIYVEATTEQFSASAKFIKGASGTSIPLLYNPYN